MKGVQRQAVLDAAISQGLLPAGTAWPAPESRPWPVVLLTTLGAWLAVVPMLLLVGLLFGDLLQRQGGYYGVGCLLLMGAVVVLRSRGLALFVEQLALPALLVGGGTLAMGLFRDLPHQAAAVAMAVLTLAVGVLVSRPWLRVLAGASAAAWVALACLPQALETTQSSRIWAAWHVILLGWLTALWVQRRGLTGGAWARRAAGLEALACGWLLTTLAGLALWAGMSFLVGASLGVDAAGDLARDWSERGAALPRWPQWGSLVCALAAAAWLPLRWPGVRRPWLAGVALVLVALAWFMPTLGAAWLAMAVCATSGRWRLAAAAGLTAAWILGAFYYQLQWPLTHKALVMMGAGAGLAALTWWAQPGAAAASPAAARPKGSSSGRLARGAIVASGLLVLLVANVGIWQKQELIAKGQPVFVALVPVDPRSLMQGDYMRLNFSMPSLPSISSLRRAQRPQLVMRRDARGVAAAQRLDDGRPLGADEFRIELTPKDGRWILVSDAWFFAEGEAARWAAARFGEFRVGPDGRALLVGLRGAELQPL